VIWRSTAQIAAALLTAGLAVWFAPALLHSLDLGEFAFVGQLCLAILALSVLEKVFRRLPAASADHETGPEPPGP
jgi:hypothetical protein